MAAQPWISNGVVSVLHTRLLGFVKTALLQQLVLPNSVVCDLFCGRGLDTERWAQAEIGRYIGVDLSASALEEAREQWEQHGKPFPAEFCELDPCMVDLKVHLPDEDLPVDIVCCLAHLQDSFTSEDRVRHLLKNVEAVLKPGGFFFGTVPDSSTIWYKYQKAVEGAMKAGSLRVNGTLPSVRTDHYKISFDDDRFQPFGSKYHMRFGDDGLPPQPQLLVHFPSLISLSRDVGLECVEIQNLCEFYDDYSGQFADVLRSCCGSLVDLKGVAVLDAKGRLNSQAVDVLSLYTTFIFKKADLSSANFRVLPTFEHETKVSRPAAVYPPTQHVEITFSYNMKEEPLKEEKSGIKVEERDLLIATNANTTDVHHQDELQQDSNAHNYEAPLEEVGAVHDQGVLEEGSAAQKRDKGEFEQLCCGSAQDRKKTYNGTQANEPLVQVYTVQDELHASVEHKLQLDTEPRILPRKEESSLETRISSAEREDPHLSTSSKVHRTVRGSGKSELGFACATQIKSKEELLPVHNITQPNLPRSSLRLDESSRGETYYKQLPVEHSPKYQSDSQNVYESSNESGKCKEYPLGEYKLKQSMQITCDSRGEVCDGKPQDPQLADHIPKHHQQRRWETLDPGHKQQDASSVNPNSKYEGRTVDSLDEINRKKQQEPFLEDQTSKQHAWKSNDTGHIREKLGVAHAEFSSKHSEWRPHDSDDEYARNAKQPADHTTRRHSRRSIEFRSKQH